jgi:methylmalonyl-CoA carboxyltransferase small subunit
VLGDELDLTSRKEKRALKLRITIEGKTYEAEVEIIEDAETEPIYESYSAFPVPYSPQAVPGSVQPLSTDVDAGDEKVCHSPINGLVISVHVVPGQTVEPNDLIIVLEAMKMETQVTARHKATVKNVLVAPGDSVKVRNVLVEFE